MKSKNIRKKTKRIFVMGGGLAGLAAGHKLSGQGYPIVISEKLDSLGGLARTIKKGKFLFDTGPHRWYTKNDAVNDWMKILLKREIIKVPRLTRIFFDGKYFYYPIRLVNALKGIGPIRSAKAVIDYLKARIMHRLFSKRKLLTMEDGYISQFGKTLYETFFKRYSEKLWGTDCRKISIDWVGQRTRGLNILTIIKDTLIKSKNVVSLVDEFLYPKKGIGMLAEKMGEDIKKQKGTIKLKSEVLKIYHSANMIKGCLVKTKNSTVKIKADEFISSIPLNDLVDRLIPKPPEKIIRLSRRLKYRDELQVALFIKKEHITKDTWVYVHPKEIPFMRFMEMDNWNRGLSPKGTTTIVFEIACNEGDVMWKKTDGEIIRLVTESFVSSMGLIDKKDVMGGYVYRSTKEYPVYHIGYREDVDKIKKYLKSNFKNLQIIGRNGTFRYNNMDHSVEMGLFAAGNIIAGYEKFDIDSVNIEREYLEEKKLESFEDETVETDQKSK